VIAETMPFLSERDCDLGERKAAGAYKTNIEKLVLIERMAMPKENRHQNTTLGVV
jgi:hypothetical protein